MALLYEKEGRIVTITLNRPEAHNAFDPQQFEEFSQACIKYRDDPDAWVAIITGAGDKAFCSGADLGKTVSDSIESGELEKPPNIMRGMDIMKPFIAAINGMALGGGLELAIACDIRIAAENVALGLPEVKWSVLPGLGGTQRLPRLIGRAKAAEMLMLGNTIKAEEAQRIGLVTTVVPQAELMPTAMKWAQQICQNGPLAVRAIKECLTYGADKPLEEGLTMEWSVLERLLASEDAAEGPKAFMEKRKPNYRAR